MPNGATYLSRGASGCDAFGIKGQYSDLLRSRGWRCPDIQLIVGGNICDIIGYISTHFGGAQREDAANTQHKEQACAKLANVDGAGRDVQPHISFFCSVLSVAVMLKWEQAQLRMTGALRLVDLVLWQADTSRNWTSESFYPFVNDQL